MDISADLTCKELVEIVTAYLDGSLDAPERLRLEKHLVVCEGCATYLDQIRATVRVVGELREEHVTPEAYAGLVATFREWKRSQ
jgi:anti-sigma factor RsiW